MPGSRWSSSIKRIRGSGNDISHSGDFEASHHAAHRLGHLFVGLPLRVVDRRENQILRVDEMYDGVPIASRNTLLSAGSVRLAAGGWTARATGITLRSSG